MSSEVVLRCEDLDAAIASYVDLGFRLDVISPADDPRAASLSGHGLRLRLERTRGVAPTEGEWIVGRAGMRYRDLIPGREGGRFIASLIQLREGGPVADYVHFHEIRFQMIYCRAGWVRVVYEDQGPPFVLGAGDCVLQPPRIRHRVLESSAGAEVVEFGSPAHHETFVEHDLELPTAVNRARAWGGQRFAHHVAASATWRPWRIPGFEARDTGISDATGGLAEVQVLRRRGPIDPVRTRHQGELLFVFVLGGSITLLRERHGPERLGEGDAIVVPPDQEHSWSEGSGELELLRVSLPAHV